MNNVSPIIDYNTYFIKQNNSNWKNIQLGTSTETVGSAGCYVCSIAMIICWYLEDGTTATKKAVITKLAANCNSSGGYKGGTITYAGHRFTTITITDMAQRLLNGYPSIAKAAGTRGTHFVVVNGYDNSGSTSWECYLVLDPGWDYDNLQEVLDEKAQRQ
ncbi:MAG: hypothetical protein PHG06_13530 [Parabacteroides sp.]|nr:hypothetical protein [Parabacteroides sp.]